MQNRLDVHETPYNSLEVPEDGSGTVWTLHVLPFHASATPPPAKPTAVQAVTDQHDTAFRLAPLTFGVIWNVQAVPFHTSTNVGLFPEVFG